MATKGGAVTANKRQPLPEPPTGGRPAFLDAKAPWISLVARLLLGAMWLYYSLPKLTQPTQNISQVRDYQILPSGLVSTFAYAQPYLELSLGLLLIVGLGTRLLALFSGILLLVYIGGIISLGARGISISCGCGGGGGLVEAGHTRYTLDVLRDVLYLIPALWLLWKPRSKYSADDALLP
ncbi:MAG TPA: MauE/DoxX family redox-associated membrane protein [Actinospica sp.]|nr:MauE/DoxX family redox-associated membrane protein [Actinospica sp.]